MTKFNSASDYLIWVAEHGTIELVERTYKTLYPLLKDPNGFWASFWKQTAGWYGKRAEA